MVRNSGRARLLLSVFSACFPDLKFDLKKFVRLNFAPSLSVLSQDSFPSGQVSVKSQIHPLMFGHLSRSELQVPKIKQVLPLSHFLQLLHDDPNILPGQVERITPPGLDIPGGITILTDFFWHEGRFPLSASYKCLSSSSYLLRWDCCVQNLVTTAAPICLSIPLYPRSRTRHHGAWNLSLGGTIPKNTWTSSYPCKNNAGSKLFIGNLQVEIGDLKWHIWT